MKRNANKTSKVQHAISVLHAIRGRQRPVPTLISLLHTLGHELLGIRKREVRKREVEAARLRAEAQRRQSVRDKLRRSDPLIPPKAGCERYELEDWVWQHRDRDVDERDLFKSATRIGHDEELMIDVLTKDDSLRKRASRAQAERECRQSHPASRTANVRDEPAHARVAIKRRPRRPNRGPGQSLGE